MQVVETNEEMIRLAAAWRRSGLRIGLVPTMGYLHAGHLSLVELARRETDKVVLTIFVNPTQFGPREDFAQYPRDLARDCDLCRAAGVDVVFHPQTPQQMYAADHSVWVEENRLATGLCGASRPGHFRGVLTIVAKLFNITQPDAAVFGQKDAQQLRLIRRMVRDLNFPVRIIAGAIVREPDGLAMSSRNTYLSAEERRDALCLMRALQLARRLYAEGERSARRIGAAMEKLIGAVPSAAIDYIAIVDDASLEPVDDIRGPVLIALAVRIGRTRLIDNLMLPDDALCSLPADLPG